MRDRETIRSLIVAAGQSRRMGEFKPLLPLRGATVIENSVASVLCGGAESAVVVTGRRADEVEAVLARRFGARVLCVCNSAYETSDMFASVRLGVRALPACDAFFFLPGDMPAVEQETFARLLRERAREPADVIFPALDGRRGHPPLIDASLRDAILTYDGENGLRGLWRRYESRSRDVAVDDAGVRIDLDTPEDYQKCQQICEKLRKEE